MINAGDGGALPEQIGRWAADAAAGDPGRVRALDVVRGQLIGFLIGVNAEQNVTDDRPHRGQLRIINRHGDISRFNARSAGDSHRQRHGDGLLRHRGRDRQRGPAWEAHVRIGRTDRDRRRRQRYRADVA